MNDLLGREELLRFAEEAIVTDLVESLKAWNVDGEALAEWANEMAFHSIIETIRSQNPRRAYATAYLIGIEIGYKLCLENETRRIAHDKT